MAVQSEINKIIYNGDGTTTTFPYTFKIFKNTDLQVILQDIFGNETLQTLNTHYSVTGVGDPNGGNVVFVTAPASGYKVIIRRTLPLTQLIDYVSNDPFPAETHEEGLDRLTMIAQQLKEAIDRTILRDSSQSASLTLPVLSPNKYLYTDGSKLDWSIPSNVTYNGIISRGLDANKPSNPAVGDIYFATDSFKLYLCKTTGIWEMLAPSILSGLDANKPTIYSLNRFYWATDTYKLYWDNGSAWVDITALFAGFVRLTDDQTITGIKDFSTAVKFAKAIVGVSGGQIDVKDNTDTTILQTIYNSGILDLPKQSGCSVHRSNVNQSIPSGLPCIIVQWTTKDYDTQNEFDNTTNYRFTATKAGIYLAIARVGFSVQSGSARRLLIYKNGSEYIADEPHLPSADFFGTVASMEISVVMRLEVNDYIDVQVYQNSGSAVDLFGQTYSSRFMVAKLS